MEKAPSMKGNQMQAAPAVAAQVNIGPVAPGSFSTTMFPGLKVERPRLEPLPGEVIIGYETTQADTGCFKCDTLNSVGWIFVILWAIVFFPVAFFMCFFPSFHEVVQRPVYGTPGSNPKRPGAVPTQVVMV